MTTSDGYRGEMDDFRHLTDRELDPLLSGHAPEAELEPLAALLGELETAYAVPVDEELSRRHVARAAEAARLAPQPVPETAPVSGFRPTRRRLATMLSTLFSSLAVKIATASVALAAVAGAGAAATGNLPDGLQATVAEAASHVGLTIPYPEGHDEGFQQGGETALDNADDEATPVLEEIFGEEADKSPTEVDGEAVADTADGERDDGDNPVDDPRSVEDDPTGNRP